MNIAVNRKGYTCVNDKGIKTKSFRYSLNIHTGKCIRRFGGIYAYCRYFIDRKW